MLPAGTLHGRLDVERAAALLAAADLGSTVLDGSRGRSTWPPAAQVAELAVRRSVDEAGLDAVAVEHETVTLPAHTPPGPLPPGCTPGFPLRFVIDPLPAGSYSAEFVLDGERLGTTAFSVVDPPPAFSGWENAYEITFTAKVVLAKGLMFRAEYRYDRSANDLFERQPVGLNRFQQDQQTVAAELSYVF